jgi:heme A synthase
MSAITDLIGKAKGNPSLLAGTIIGILTLVFVAGVIGGAILIFGLNLMGFAIPYTIKTMLGAALVISCLRSIGGSNSK